MLSAKEYGSESGAVLMGAMQGNGKEGGRRGQGGGDLELIKAQGDPRQGREVGSGDGPVRSYILNPGACS